MMQKMNKQSFNELDNESLVQLFLRQKRKLIVTQNLDEFNERIHETITNFGRENIIKFKIRSVNYKR